MMLMPLQKLRLELSGTDVQAYDAELAAVAGLTSAADKGISSRVMVLLRLTIYCCWKALLDDAVPLHKELRLGCP